MHGERLGLLEPGLQVRDKARGSTLRATAGAAIVATLALGAIAGGLLRGPLRFGTVTPLGVSRDEYATLRRVVTAPDPVNITDHALSAAELGEMVAMLGRSGEDASGEIGAEDDVSEETTSEDASGPEQATEETTEETSEPAPAPEQTTELAPAPEETTEQASGPKEATEDWGYPAEKEIMYSDGDAASLGKPKKQHKTSVENALRPNPTLAASFMRAVKASVAASGDVSGLGKQTPAEADESWTAPTYFITLGRSGESGTIAPALASLTEAYGTNAVLRNVRATPGVDIELWPEKVDVARYAVSGVVARARIALETADTDSDSEPSTRTKTHTDAAILGGLPWLDILTSVDDNGKVTDPELLSRGHHFGCLLAHMAQWQMASDVGNKDTMVFESDGFLPGLLGVPVSGLGAVQQHAPDDYDIVFLHHPGEGSLVGDLVSEFESEAGDALEIYKYEHPNGPSGLSGYMFSAKFVQKMLPLIASRGADMVDAWLAGHLCRPLPENDWAYDLPHYAGANGGNGVQWGEKFLNCYKAMSKGAELPSE